MQNGRQRGAWLQQEGGSEKQYVGKDKKEGAGGGLKKEEAKPQRSLGLSASKQGFTAGPRPCRMGRRRQSAQASSSAPSSWRHLARPHTPALPGSVPAFTMTRRLPPLISRSSAAFSALVAAGASGVCGLSCLACSRACAELAFPYLRGGGAGRACSAARPAVGAGLCGAASQAASTARGRDEGGLGAP